MPIQAPQWTEFLTCPICCNDFHAGQHSPISLGCGHTVCRACLSKLQRNQCPYDQTVMNIDLDQLPVNVALLSLVSSGVELDRVDQSPPRSVPPDYHGHYLTAIRYIKDLASYLKPFSGANGSTSLLSRPMQRKLVTLINCQLVEKEGRVRAVRAARSLGERTVTELILQHQNHQQLSANLWAAVRMRGCQFLGPAMQEEVLRLVLLALEDGAALSRKVLVMFVVQRLEPHFPQASKTSIGHVVQLLYRASCFKVSKREKDSSLMQLKEEFRTYEALRREHDAQIVQIATEAGLRIAPDQWSSLLYGDIVHKSHMQSIIDKLQTPQSFLQSVQELVIALQKTGDPGHLSSLRPHLELLAALDPSPDAAVPAWEPCTSTMEAVYNVVFGLVRFIKHHGNRKLQESHHPHNFKYKTSMCRDLAQRGDCLRGESCTFAHSEEELDKYRSRSKRHNKSLTMINATVKHSAQPSVTVQPSSQVSLQTNPPSIQHQISPAVLNQSPQPTPLPCPQPMQPVHPLPPPPPPPHPQFAKLIPSPIRNGEHAQAYSVITPTVVVDDLIHPGLSQLPAFEPSPKYVPLPAQTQALTVLPAQAASLVRPIPPAPVFASQMPEFAYSPFPAQAQVLAPARPAVAHTPTPQAFFPPQSVLMNQTPVFNFLSQQQDYFRPLEETKGSSVCNAVMTTLPSSSIATSDYALSYKRNNENNRDNIVYSLGTSCETSMPFKTKSLAELKERKNEILNELENIIGRDAVLNVETKVARGEDFLDISIPRKESSQASSVYNIWTSGADFYSITKSTEKSWESDVSCRSSTNDFVSKNEEDLNAFEFCSGSQFGPICRTTRNGGKPTSIRVSACGTTEPFTTPTVRRPVPTASPITQVAYPPAQRYVGFMTYSAPNLDMMNTIGHGIIDPPHLHMSNLEPSGCRPSDPLSTVHELPEGMGPEERHRQQLNAVREGIDSLSVGNKDYAELRLKQELSMIVHGIEKKQKELKSNSSSQEEELGDFEHNWKFDFDEKE